MARRFIRSRFDAPRPGALRRGRWRRSLAIMVAAIGVGLGSWGVTRWNERAGPWDALPQKIDVCGEPTSWRACAIDGDTLSLAAPGGKRRRVRLTGYDAPEIAGKCAAESALALKARSELVRWLNERPAFLDGGANPPRDDYRRELRRGRRVLADGRTEWLDDHMVEAGLAHRDGPAIAGDWC